MRRQFSSRRLTLILLIVLIIAILAYGVGNQSSSTPIMKSNAAFNFDDGYPHLDDSQNTPFNQTSNGITAYFDSPSDPAAFSIQSDITKSLKLSQLSGKYLYDNKPSKDILDISFSKNVVAIKFTFATIETCSEVATEPSEILLTAYENTNLVGSTRTSGSFSSDSYPQGTLSFGSGQPFNLVRVTVPTQPSRTIAFIIDKIEVTIAKAFSAP